MLDEIYSQVREDAVEVEAEKIRKPYNMSAKPETMNPKLKAYYITSATLIALVIITLTTILLSERGNTTHPTWLAYTTAIILLNSIVAAIAFTNTVLKVK